MYPSSLLLPLPRQVDLEKNHRILVVDDNEAIHDDFRKILQADPDEAEFDAEEAEIFGRVGFVTPRLKFELSFASQGARALELVAAAGQCGHRFSLVFMDVRMPPGWDGLETTRRLWDVDPDLQIVICTAYSDRSWEQMMGNLANSERVLILKKPFDPIEVLQLAHALTEKWSLLQDARRNRNDLERLVSERTLELVSANSQLAIETASHKASADRVREQAMLLEKARDAIMVRSLDDIVQFWNHGAEALYGWTAAEAVGKKIHDLIYDGVVDRNLVAAKEAVMQTGGWIGELVQKTRDGRTVTAECRWSLVYDDAGLPKSILGINTDITGKKQLEAKYLRAQRMESIGTLAGGIAHDLNNILQPITLSMDILRTQIANPSSRNLLDLISKNTQRATALVKQVLSFARGVEGERIAIHPNALARDISSIVSQTFPKNISFRLCPAEDEWLLSGDSTQLHQVLLNLCVNARDAMPGGGILTLSVENVEVGGNEAAIQPEASAGRHVVWTVADTGTGIPSALVEKIWDPFFTTKELGKGTGLGLATSHSIVRSHGGFITVATEEDRGTRFRVYLPAVDSVADPKAGAARVTVETGEMPGHGELILVVDDEAPIISVMRHTLQAFGYRVISASDGASGLSAYFQNRNEIKAVITDMVMPGMDGPALVAALREADPTVRIIATTGMTTDANIEAIKRLGVTRIISKPFAARAILDALADVLAVKSPPAHRLIPIP